MSSENKIETKNKSNRPYCSHCRGKGWFVGAERPCPWCNPGGEWRKDF